MEYKNGTVLMSKVTLSGSPPANSIILTGLDARAGYRVKVRAVSEIGVGTWSAVQMEGTGNSEYVLLKVHVYFRHAVCYSKRIITPSAS